MVLIEFRSESGPRKFGIPGTGDRRHVARVGDEVTVSVGSLSRTTRKADVPLAGSAGQGAVLERRRWTRWRLLGPDGAERFHLQSKTGRPTRGMRQTWDLSMDGQVVLSVADTGSMSTLTDIKRDLRGQEIASYLPRGDDAGMDLRLRIHASSAAMELSDTLAASSPWSDPLIAGAFGLVVWRMHQRPEL